MPLHSTSLVADACSRTDRLAWSQLHAGHGPVALWPGLSPWSHALAPGLVLVCGGDGAGKTSLLQPAARPAALAIGRGARWPWHPRWPCLRRLRCNQNPDSSTPSTLLAGAVLWGNASIGTVKAPGMRRWGWVSPCRDIGYLPSAVCHFTRLLSLQMPAAAPTDWHGANCMPATGRWPCGRACRPGRMRWPLAWCWYAVVMVLEKPVCCSQQLGLQRWPLGGGHAGHGIPGGRAFVVFAVIKIQIVQHRQPSLQGRYCGAMHPLGR